MWTDELSVVTFVTTSEHNADVQLMIAARQVLPGPAGSSIHDGAILIEGERIARVGERAVIEPHLKTDALLLDFGDSTVLPGLINAHVHLVFEPGTDHEQRMRTVADDELLLSMAQHARQLLDGGVTTARDLGDRDGSALVLRDAVDAGRMVGPRLLIAGAPLTAVGGHCWFLGGEVSASSIGYEPAIRARVCELAASGVDVIKVMASGGQITAGGASMWERQFDAADLRVVVEEARRFGLPVAVHAHGADSIADAVAAGVNTIEHCSWMSGPGASDFRDDVADHMASAGIVACAASSGNPSALAGRVAPERLSTLFGRMRRMADHGVPVIFGDDAGLTAFDNFGQILQNWSQWGFDASEVIELATVAAARALKLEAVTGQLEPGLAADLLVVSGDPLDELDALGRVRAVFARGRLHQPASDA